MSTKTAAAPSRASSRSPAKSKVASAAKTSAKSPLRRKPIKGLQQHSNGLKVYVIRVKGGFWIAIVVNSNPKAADPYLVDFADWVKASDYEDIHWIYPRRDANAPGHADVELMDSKGKYPLRVFVRSLGVGEEDTEEEAAKWGHELAEKITQVKASSKYPKQCTYGGSLTNPNGLDSVDTHVMNKDVVEMVEDTYGRDQIDDGTFFRCEEEVRNFFGHTPDPRPLFFQQHN